jgi:hypothetical protein
VPRSGEKIYSRRESVAGDVEEGNLRASTGKRDCTGPTDVGRCACDHDSIIAELLDTKLLGILISWLLEPSTRTWLDTTQIYVHMARESTTKALEATSS